MAAGDPVNDVDSMAAGAVIDFTPAAGTIYKITAFLASQSTQTLWLGTVFGGVAAFVMLSSDWASGTPRYIDQGNINIFIDSNTSLRRENNSAGARVCGYSGIQLK